MTSKDDSDPIANTEMFRRFTDGEAEAAKQSGSSRGPLLMVLLAVLVVAIVVAAILALR